MKIVSLNIAGRSNFGKDFDERMRGIAKFLDEQQADIVYMQLQELIEYDYHPDIIVGDFNIHTNVLMEHKDIWSSDYIESTELKDYVSFPEENATFDHMLLRKSKYVFSNVEQFDDLSDHSAMIYMIEQVGQTSVI